MSDSREDDTLNNDTVKDNGLIGKDDGRQKSEPQDAKPDSASSGASAYSEQDDEDKDETLPTREDDQDATINKAPPRRGIMLNVDHVDPSKPDTAVLSRRNLPRRLTGSDQVEGQVTFGDQRELLLVIRGIVERLVVPKDISITLGRSDIQMRFRPDVDLTAYGAIDRGVSREHARLHTEGEQLYITDLGSTNGTFVAGRRLEPNTPTLLRKGDELLLGRLAIQVLFR